MIAAVSTVLDEEQIIAETVANLYRQGIDEVYIYLGPCKDRSREVLAPFPVTILDDPEPVHYQPKLITELTHRAGAAGADWILPFDADEFWFPEKAATVKEALEALEPNVGVTHAGQYHYHTREMRNPTSNANSKVCFRYHPAASVANGNHHVAGIPGENSWGVLLIKEWQYQDFDHYVRKVRQRIATLDPVMHARGDGFHHYRLDALTDEELLEEWKVLEQAADTYDPIT